MTIGREQVRAWEGEDNILNTNWACHKEGETFEDKKDREVSCMRWHILAFGGAFTEQTSECLLDLAWVADTTNTKSTAINTPIKTTTTTSTTTTTIHSIRF